MFIPTNISIAAHQKTPAKHRVLGQPGFQHIEIPGKWLMISLLLLILFLIPVLAVAGEWDEEETLSYRQSSAVLGQAALKDGDSPALGRTVTTQEIAAYDLTIFPDGTGLPVGQGNVHDGEILYVEHCQSCHGPSGRGLSAEELVGGIGSLDSPVPELTIGSYWPYSTTVFDYLRRSMPIAHPLSLSADQLYALSAYLLHLNGIVPADAVLNQTNLARIRMPNRDGFKPVDHLSSRELPPAQ